MIVSDLSQNAVTDLNINFIKVTKYILDVLIIFIFTISAFQNYLRLGKNLKEKTVPWLLRETIKY